MPSRRDAIRMSADELRAYLEGQRRIVLVTIGADGMPHPVPMNYGVDEAGRVLITSFAKSQKVLNLRRDPRATLLVESGEAYAELKAAILWCSAEIVEDPQAIREGMNRIRADGGMTVSLSPEMDVQVRASIAKRVLLRFTPLRETSWDHGKIEGFY